MDNKKFNALGDFYQKLYDCQDMAESVGEFPLMQEFEDLRRKVDYIRFNY